MITAFVRGDVDAVALWEPHSSKARKLGDGKTLVSGTYSFLGPQPVARRVYGDHAVLFVTETTLKEQPAITRSVLAALQKANTFIEANRAEAIAILAKEYGLDAVEMEAVIDVNRYTLRLDDQLVTDIDALADFLYSIKRIANPVHVREAIDTTALKALNPELVNLR